MVELFCFLYIFDNDQYIPQPHEFSPFLLPAISISLPDAHRTIFLHTKKNDLPDHPAF